MVNNWLEFDRYLGALAACAVCGGQAQGHLDICSGCEAELPVHTSACQCCAEPLPKMGVCGQCLQQSPAFDYAWAAFTYAPPVDTLLRGLKFHQRLSVARLLGQMMAKQIEHDHTLPELILPVPLHRARLRERGFNQAQMLAQEISSHLNIPMALDVCQRSVSTQAQAGMDKAARKRNLTGAFTLNRPVGAERVVLVDDVMTTGSTLNVLASLLKRAGVKEVGVWVCARAILG